MKRSLVLAASLLASSIASAGPYYFDDYLPFSNSWSYVLPTSGGTIAYGQWATWSPDAMNMAIHWTSDGSTTGFNWNALASVENFEIRPECSDGAAWVFLNGYRHNTDPNIIFWLKAEKVLVKVASEVVYDVTHIARQPGGCARYQPTIGEYVGIPYAPYQFWDQTYEFEVWGRIADANGNFARAFYWKALYDPRQSAMNPCWVDVDITRHTILQQEAYWDSISGWGVGSGTVDMSNLSAAEVKYGRYQRYGKSAGPGWLTGSVLPNGELSPPTGCLRNAWAY